MKMDISNKQIEDAGHDTDDAAKVRALCSFLDCEPDDLTKESYEHYRLDVFSMGKQEYAIGDEDEAQAAAIANIKDSAWAFNADFLAGFCELPEEVFKCLQGKCEDSNDAVLSLIEKSGGIQDFAEQAISADGRGHFLSGYDGNENEEGEFYIYRTN